MILIAVCFSDIQRQRNRFTRAPRQSPETYAKKKSAKRFFLCLSHLLLACSEGCTESDGIPETQSGCRCSHRSVWCSRRGKVCYHSAVRAKHLCGALW